MVGMYVSYDTCESFNSDLSQWDTSRSLYRLLQYVSVRKFLQCKFIQVGHQSHYNNDMHVLFSTVFPFGFVQVEYKSYYNSDIHVFISILFQFGFVQVEHKSCRQPYHGGGPANKIHEI